MFLHYYGIDILLKTQQSKHKPLSWYQFLIKPNINFNPMNE